LDRSDLDVISGADREDENRFVAEFVGEQAARAIAGNPRLHARKAQDRQSV
jgi:hypothetical protein